MKNLTKLSVLAASLMLAGNALAVDDVTEGSGEVKVTGHVPVNCTVTVGEGDLDLGHNPPVGENFSFEGDITFECNNKAGANIDLVSANGGLANDESEDHVIDYSAWLQILNTSEPVMNGIGGPFVELVCKDTSCDSNTVMTAPKDVNLAMGMVEGILSVAVTEDIKFSGFYNDTLTVAISAKL